MRKGFPGQGRCPRELPWGDTCCSLRTKTVCMRLARLRLPGFGAGHLLPLCFGKGIPLFLGAPRLPVQHNGHPGRATGSGAGGTVTISAACISLARGTCVLVPACTHMVFAFLSNLNLCNFKGCDYINCYVFNLDCHPKGQT